MPGSEREAVTLFDYVSNGIWILLRNSLENNELNFTTKEYNIIELILNVGWLLDGLDGLDG